MKMFHSEPVEKTASISPKLRDERVSRILVNRRKTALLGCAAVAVTAALLAAVGCGGSAQSSRGMTSYSGSSSEPGDKARLFTLPADQMAHVQIVTVEPTSIVRTLRLTGAVSFNGFDTTPVITQVSGPVSRIVVMPGQQVHRGEPLLYVASPDYSQLVSELSESARCICAGGQELWSRQRPLRSQRNRGAGSGSSRVGADAGGSGSRRG